MNPFYILCALSATTILSLWASALLRKPWTEWLTILSFTGLLAYIPYFFYLLNEYLQHNFQFVGQVLQYIVSHQGMPS